MKRLIARMRNASFAICCREEPTWFYAQTSLTRENGGKHLPERNMSRSLSKTLTIC